MLMLPPAFSCNHKTLIIQHKLITWIVAIGGICFTSQEIIISHDLPFALMALFMLSSKCHKIHIYLSLVASKD